MKSAVGIMGVSPQESNMIAAVTQLHRKGFLDVEIYSPIPCEIPSEALKVPKSPVRFYTLVGGIVGFLSGLALTIGTVLEWPLLTGGKPLISIPPFLVICFELTILLGGLSTLAGVAIHGSLKPVVSLEAPQAGYDGRFSVDRFGIFVPCDERQKEEVREVFLAAGVEETSGETA